jgi:hypothetical protein
MRMASFVAAACIAGSFAAGAKAQTPLELHARLLRDGELPVSESRAVLLS